MPKPISAAKVDPKSSPKQVVLRGFFAKGNMGDEALSHSIIRHIGPEFSYKFALNSPALDATTTHWPYKGAKCIDSLNRGEVMKPEVCGFFLGGGGLGLGFGYNQMICARRAGKAIVHSGVHIHEDFFSKKDPVMVDASRAMLKLAHITTVRDRLSIDVMTHYDVPGEWAPDWAFGLKAEPWDAPLPSSDYIVVTFRARPPDDVELITPWLQGVRDFAASLGCEIVVVPFDAGDAKLAAKLGFGDKTIKDLYFAPEKAKHVIAGARAVVSFGRFHPVVFALAEHVPAFAVDFWFARETGHKTTLLLREDGMEEGIYHRGLLDDFTADKLGARLSRLQAKMKKKPFANYPTMLADLGKRIQALMHAH